MNLEQLSKYPILSHYDSTQIVEKADGFKKGQLPIYNILKLALIAAVIYFSWIYILPTVFIALGKLAAVVITILSIVFLFLARKPIFGFLKLLSRKMSEALINQEPFEELDRQRKKLEDARKQVTTSKIKIAGLEAESFKRAKDFEKKTEQLKIKIKNLRDKGTDIKVKMENMQKNNPDYAIDDMYISYKSEFLKVANEGKRAELELQQSMSFIQRYGVNGNTMKKLKQKLYLAEIASDNKLADLDLTITMLQHEYQFASESRKGTDAAKKAMLIDKNWELEYAMNVITNTIAQDVAATVANIKDIERLTTDFNFDSDELFKQLDTLADNIQADKIKTPDSNKYKNENLILSDSEKQNSTFKGLF